MKESLELSQQQRLQQRLHPEQMLYGRLLEMSTPEIEDEVRRVVDENPALTELGAESDNTGVESGEGTFVESAEQLQRADYGDDDDVPFYRYGARSAFDEPGYEMPERFEMPVDYFCGKFGVGSLFHPRELQKHAVS